MTVSHNAPAMRAPKSGDGSVDLSDDMTSVLIKSVVSTTDNLVFSYSQGDSSGAIDRNKNRRVFRSERFIE